MFSDLTPRSAVRSGYFTFRVNAAERDFMKAAASDADLSVGQWLRKVLAKETRSGELDEEQVIA